MTSPIGCLKDETLDKILQEYTPDSIKFNWRGEPLLIGKDLYRFIRKAKDAGVKEVLLNTNGKILTPTVYKELHDAGLDWLIISVDGATKETYEKIRVGGNFDILINRLRLINILRRVWETPKVRIQICRQPDNANEIPLWRYKFSPLADEIRVGNLFDPQGKNGWKIKSLNDCSQPYQRMTIAYNGDIHICPAEYLGEFIIGNVKDMTIKEAWHSPRMRDVREGLETIGRKFGKPCSQCSSYC